MLNLTQRQRNGMRYVLTDIEHDCAGASSCANDQWVST